MNDSASSASLPNAFPLSVGTLTDSFFPQQSLSSAAKLELERELTDATAHIRHLDADNGGVLFARDWSSNGGVDGLFSFCPVPVLSEFKVTCGAATGDVSSLMDVHKVSFSEVRAAIESHSATAENSMSLKRAPSQSAEFHRGSSTNFPFTPGFVFCKNLFFKNHPSMKIINSLVTFCLQVAFLLNKVRLVRGQNRRLTQRQQHHS